MPLQTVNRLADLREAVDTLRAKGPVALVPTMGALHEGHLTLVREAKKRVPNVVVSIFVNPTQFGPQEDFARYPRNLEVDLKLCGEAGADVVFHPSVETIYQQGFATFVEVAGLSE